MGTPFCECVYTSMQEAHHNGDDIWIKGKPLKQCRLQLPSMFSFPFAVSYALSYPDEDEKLRFVGWQVRATLRSADWTPDLTIAIAISLSLLHRLPCYISQWLKRSADSSQWWMKIGEGSIVAIVVVVQGSFTACISLYAVPLFLFGISSYGWCAGSQQLLLTPVSVWI